MGDDGENNFSFKFLSGFVEHVAHAPRATKRFSCKHNFQLTPKLILKVAKIRKKHRHYQIEEFFSFPGQTCSQFQYFRVHFRQPRTQVDNRKRNKNHCNGKMTVNEQYQTKE